LEEAYKDQNKEQKIMQLQRKERHNDSNAFRRMRKSRPREVRDPAQNKPEHR